MDRNQLRALLTGADDVQAMCGRALAAGAPFTVWDDTVPARDLVSTYSRRERHLRRTGQPEIGFAEAVSALRAVEGDQLLLGFVDDRERGGYYFQLFLGSDGGSVVACLAVKRSEKGERPHGSA